MRTRSRTARRGYESCRRLTGRSVDCGGPEPEALGPRLRRRAVGVPDRLRLRARQTPAPRIAADPVPGAGPTSGVRRLRRDRSRNRAPTGTSYGTDRPRASEARARSTSRRRTNGGSNWSPLTRINPAAEGTSVLPGHRRERRAGCTSSGRTPASTPRGPPDGGRLQHGSVLEPAAVERTRPVPSRARVGVQSFYSTLDEQGIELDDAARFVRRATCCPVSSSADATSRSSGTTTTSRRSGSKVLMTWADERDTVPGTDPRYTNGDGTDGFDVLQCREPAPARHRRAAPTRARTRAASTRTSGAWSSAELRMTADQEEGRLRRPFAQEPGKS